jgi:hypothetical protein
LPEPHRSAALDAALTGTPDPIARAEILSRFSVHLPEPDRDRACVDALDAVRAIDGWWSRLSAYVELVVWLPAPYRDEAHAEAVAWAEEAADAEIPAARAAEQLNAAFSRSRPTSEPSSVFEQLFDWLGRALRGSSVAAPAPVEPAGHSPEALRVAELFTGRDQARVLDAFAAEQPALRLHEIFDTVLQDAADDGVHALKKQALALGVLLEHVWSTK